MSSWFIFIYFWRFNRIQLPAAILPLIPIVNQDFTVVGLWIVLLFHPSVHLPSCCCLVVVEFWASNAFSELKFKFLRASERCKSKLSTFCTRLLLPYERHLHPVRNKNTALAKLRKCDEISITTKTPANNVSSFDFVFKFVETNKIV